tara:strand:+ start:1952 stop:3484 length:1533 start_codon:yes stop_codon:yes gene_type:complete
MAPRPEPRADEQQLVLKMLSLCDDPYAFVMFAFPWGKPNGPLENMAGPRGWQKDILIEMRDHIAANRNRTRQDLSPELMKIAVASGRGIGKSAFLAWIALWLFSCVPSSTIVVTANTEQQLKATTFPEIRKWATMSIHSNWFDHNAMSLRPAPWLVESLKQTTDLDDAYWYIQARLWSEESPDAFAGIHSQRGMAVLFDEASGIPSCIWPVTQGFFTDLTIHRFWVAISNPRNPSGAFFECFHSKRGSWNTRTVDARSVAENDRALYDSIIAEYGEDSDQARVEVFGQFPRQGDQQFISRGEVDDAMEREEIEDKGAALVMGVDPARFGDDEAVIAFRQGRNADIIPWQKYKRCSTTELASYCADAIEKFKPDAVFVEGDGVGGGVIDILKEFGYRVIEVTAGGGAENKDMYMNHRTELWGRVRDWLPTAKLPDDKPLADDLAAPMYQYTLKGQLQLESKDKMKKRGYSSPNNGDALAMTFSRTVARRDLGVSQNMKRRRVVQQADYSPI